MFTVKVVAYRSKESVKWWPQNCLFGELKSKLMPMKLSDAVVAFYLNVTIVIIYKIQTSVLCKY